MKSDAYATSTALYALNQAGGLSTADPSYQQGVKFLISSQLPDGSWHVATRSKPIQSYYESGYPHGKDQFASITAAGWATTVLAMAIPEQPPSAKKALDETLLRRFGQ
jgi:squalene cyclase